jgi:DNA-directed RNA polymerase subunit RPC12/RpoP
MIVPPLRIGPLLQYFCSSCSKILKDRTILEIQNQQIKEEEECPFCGALLLDTLQNRTVSTSVPEQAVVTCAIPKSLQDLSVEFRTAFHQIEDSNVKFTFDIEKIGSLLNLNAYGSLCIIGEQKYTQILINRLCVHSLLSKRYGGTIIGGPNYSKIIAIDAGNCTDVYQFVDFARQYGLEVKKVLQSVIVSRIFTIYQLAYIIVFELPKIIEQFSSTSIIIIVIYGLLHLFVSDTHTDKVDAKNLTKEIASSLRKISKGRFIIVSFAHCNMEYEKLLLPAFDRCIEITNNNIDNGKILQIDINNHNNHAMNRKKGISYSRPVRVSKRELLSVPPR